MHAHKHTHVHARTQTHTCTCTHTHIHIQTHTGPHRTRMWANAQRDGRPAEYSWRPLLTTAVWLMPTTGVPCSNAAKMRNPLKLVGVSQTNETIPTVSGPKFTILCRHQEEILLLNKFFFLIVDTCLSCEDIARQSRTMVHRWRFFASCISSEPCAACFRPASQICTKATPCVEVC